MRSFRVMRLIHVTTVPETLFFFRGQARFFEERGLEEQVISSPGSELGRFVAEENVRAFAVEMKRSISPLHDLGALVRLVRLLRRQRPHIVHAHTPKGGLLGMIAATLSGVPVRVYHVHGLPFVTARGVRRALLRLSERVSCGLAHKVLCVSRSVAAQAVREGFCPPGRIEVLLEGSINGVDATRRFTPRPDEGARVRRELGIPLEATVIGFVGRFVRDKGVRELWQAFAELAREWPALHLLAVGPEEEADLSLPAHARIHVRGFTTALAPYYAAMDVLTLPSWREGFPVVPLEAAAMALPVVATRIPGCVDAVVDGETGLVVQPGDALALADALRQLVRDPARRRALGAAGRARVLRDFRPEAMWRALADTYAGLLGRPLTAPLLPHAEPGTAEAG